MTIIDMAKASANSGVPKPWYNPIARVVETIKDECELGIPPLLNHKAQFQRRLVRYSIGTLRNWPKNQPSKAQINTWFENSSPMAGYASSSGSTVRSGSFSA